MLSLEQGALLVRMAREAIKGEEREHRDEFLKEKKGVFVTLYSFPDKTLRGCIGFPYPVKPLGEAVREAARAAAFEDPRFFPVSPDELDKIVVEVSVLSEPKRLDCRPEERPEHVVIGKHGIIIRKGQYSGLLLPQVAVEYDLGPEEFLSDACLKAGIEASAWKDFDTMVYLFTAQVFSEEEPGGKVVEEEVG